jgi:hypothetical protein
MDEFFLVPKPKRTLRPLLGVLAAVSLIAVFAVQSALAVHDLQFQLDGDTDVDAVAQPYDWESFFGASGNELPLPSNFTDSGFVRDFSRNANGTYNTTDPTTYATGSKDTLSISPGWQCNRDNNVNDKIDITNAYAAVYEAPANDPAHNIEAGDQILYFALERFSNDGDANVAFWFLQGDVSCVSPGGSTAFIGDHQDGDILVVSSFTKGGVVSTVDAYLWEGDDNTGGLSSTSFAHGADCRDATKTPVNDTTCATVNTVTINPPWDNENKRGGANIRTAEFYEGGINITEAGVTGECFATFLGNTRSSQELGATLFDFALGQLGECDVTVATSPSVSTIQLGAGTVTDTATVTGTGGVGTPPVPTGTVAFFVCQPSELDANGECSAGGTQVGTPVEGEDLFATTNPSQSAATSEAYTPTVVGKHCWRAEYSGDDAYDATAHFDGTTECFTVTGRAALTTAQRWRPNDSATLTGPSNLNGTLTFTLYTGDNCGVTSGAAVPSQQYVVTVTNAASGSTFSTSNTTFDVVAANAGSYSWLVHYDDNVLADPDDRCEKSTVSITD